MEKIKVNDREEYDYILKGGYCPLIDSRFDVDIRLRVKLQKEIFGKCIIGRGDNIQRANERFFRWIWENKKHYCEETMQPLRGYSAVYCSHILTRGSHPEMAHDPRNINLLTFEMHNKWENGNRKEMRIYEKNQRTIELLKQEYNEL